MQNNRTNFCSQNNYFGKVPISHVVQNHQKNQLYYELFSFSLTVKYNQLYKFRIWNCLWNHNAYRLVFWKVFLFQMLGENFIFALPSKVLLSQKCENDGLCGNMNRDISPFISKFKFFFKILILQWLLGFMLAIVVKTEMIYLPEQVCLIIIYRNTTYSNPDDQV